MHSLRELAHQRSIITMEQFLEQVAWPGALPLMVRPNEAAPPEPTPARVEPVPADPQSPVVNPPSPKLEPVPPSPPIIIISNSPSREVVAPSDSPVGEAANLFDSLSGEAVALPDSPIFHLIDEKEAQTQDTQDPSQDF
ncbi:hypothetical protein JHK85_045466 [Glycine max]|uniref:Uncharacterized protein n=1 Tax=Glycine soja TaxID=3848 RepID=A0A0B2PRA1_GLYSO|nr:hypothetical protein JHK85_045466 [Glycine max]KHN10122.1 hypothetical protein glysoja_046241 [Glycine soja]